MQDSRPPPSQVASRLRLALLLLLAFEEGAARSAHASLEVRCALNRLRESWREGAGSWGPIRYWSDRRAAHEARSRAADLSADFFEMVSGQPDPQRLAESLVNWVKTDDQALIVYKNLEKLQSRDEVLAELFRSNEIFKKKVRPVAGSKNAVMTFSFEKETHSSAITDLYKVAPHTDENWIALPEAERSSRLRDALKNTGAQLLQEVNRRDPPAGSIQATSLKPEYLSGIKLEAPIRDRAAGGINRNAPPYEIKHAAFEINLDRALDQIEDLAQGLKENDAFHLHLVTELPAHYVNSVQLSSWFKNLNDYLLLSGMEEGLHPAGVTEFLYSASLPSKLDQLNTKSYKYYSAGFRTKIYGDASTPGYVKIGIELRDVTRDLAKLRRIASRVADSISLRSWEQPVSTKAKLLSLSQDSAKSLHNVRARLIRSGADAEQVKQAFLSEPNITLPLIPFEDLVKSSGKALPPEAAARIHKARVHFESELGLLGAEMARMKTAGQDFDRAELGMAIRMILSDWAKRAQLSSIYEDLI